MCGVELRSACLDNKINQPLEGTAFMTHGHYGSTLFDSIDGSEYLEIAICDNCLRRNSKHTRISKTDMDRPPASIHE